MALSIFVKSTFDRNGKHQKTLCGRYFGVIPKISVWLVDYIGQGLSQKDGKMLALSNKKFTFVLVSGFFGPLYFHNFVQILFERSLFN